MRCWVLFMMVVTLSCPLAWASDQPSEPTQHMLHKVSTVLLQQWKSTHARKRTKTWVECFLRLKGVAEAATLQSLQLHGVEVRSVIPNARERQHPATLLTARLRLADLPSVAALEVVESIEGAVRVTLKPEHRMRVEKSLRGKTESE